MNYGFIMLIYFINLVISLVLFGVLHSYVRGMYKDLIRPWFIDQEEINKTIGEWMRQQEKANRELADWMKQVEICLDLLTTHVEESENEDTKG